MNKNKHKTVFCGALDPLDFWSYASKNSSFFFNKGKYCKTYWIFFFSIT